MNDYVWLTEASKIFLERDYLVAGQTVDERVDIICNNAEKILKKPGFAKKFKDNLKKGWYSLSTPIWSNFGTKRALPISCFGSYISDDTESIAYTHAETMMMTKHGGGTSGYFGNLRSRGSKIGQSNGESSGSVHFMQLFDLLINIISQGRTRRGNFAAYLPIDHPDIEEFLNIKSESSPIQDLSFGICVPDDWLNDMIDGDLKKRKIWAKVLEKRANVGFPYIIFIDNANRNTVDVYKDKGMKITHSNLCVTGDQRVVSNHGLLTVKELYERGDKLILFDNEKAVKSSPMQLIEKDADVYEIKLSNGMSHKVTSYHKILISKQDKNKKEFPQVVSCSDLNIGDRVAVQTSKGLFGCKNMPDEAYLLGLYQSDGTQYKDIIMLDVWEQDFDLLEDIQEKFNKIHYNYGCDQYEISLPNCKYNRFIKPAKFINCVVANGSVKKKRLASKTLYKALNFNKGFVPDWIYSSDEETMWSYVKGLLFADGAVHVSKSKGEPIQIAYSDINKDFLVELQILLSNLGIQSSIKILRKEGVSLLPDGKGGNKYYQTKTCWRLIVGNKNDALVIEEKTGFLSRKGIYLEKRDYRDNTKKYSKVKSISYIGKEDVYCCKVDSDEHLWVCNGVITHNCTEIFLANNEEESFVCDLSSMNLLHYDEWKDTDAVEILTYFLDAVMTEFIEMASNIKFMDRAVRFAKRHRALGIGWIGWHSLLQSKMVPFESMEAKYLNTEIASNIKKSAYLASEKMAKEYGEPEVLKGYGRRNTTLLAIAPTKSSAFIMGQASEGIEPHRSNYFIKDLQKGKFTIKNQHLEKLFQEKDQDKPEVWQSILRNSGSVQHLDFLSEHEKSVFKTFQEISPREIIIQASQRQRHIDQGQSLNLMIHPSVSAKDVNQLVLEAWRLGVVSLYYQISVNAAQEFSKNILSCASCEG